MPFRLVAFVCTVVVVVAGAVGVASAHVTIDPTTAARGAADQTIVFRVPDEQPSANTVRVRVQIPTAHPIGDVTPLQIAGWTSTVVKTKLPAPIKTDDGAITEAVSEVDWSDGKIEPDHYAAFTVLAQGLPTDVDQLTFKTIQVYDNGQQTAWIEVADPTNPNPEHPAPILHLTAVDSDAAPTTTPPGSTPTATTPTARAVPSVTEADGDKVASGVTPQLADQINSSDASKTQVNVALVLAAIGIIMAGVALFVARAKPR